MDILPINVHFSSFLRKNMIFFTVILGIFFSLFSTLILSYVSMATMVGPWIAPTIVLLSHSCIALFFTKSNDQQTTKSVAIMQAIGSGGGIIATGVGFALPMLYFLDADIFLQWLKNPWYFCTLLTIICILAGGLGLLLGRWWSWQFLDEQKLPFPVSNLTYQVITSKNHPSQAKKLLHGIGGTLFVCFARDGIRNMQGIISKTYYLFPSILAKEVALSIWPSLWSIGFTVGLSITIPLCIGMISKYLVLYPLANHALYLPYSLFEPLAPEIFAIAFCSGLVACELILNMPNYIKLLWRSISRLSLSQLAKHIFTIKNRWSGVKTDNVTVFKVFEISLISIGMIALFSYFKFSLITQIFLLIFTIIATYSINQIGGEIGMIPFGRFSTFIVVPLLFLFNLTSVQATITCVFFNICAATASDLLFDYKTGDLCLIDRKKMYAYQWIGLIATALGIGIFLWLLFTHLELGTEALFAQRGKAKALLLQSLYFDKYIVGLGIVFGWILKKCKVNPTMVFGGLIMPNSISIGLLIGSLGTLLTKNTEKYQPICAGILAAESLWILITILAKIV